MPHPCSNTRIGVLATAAVLAVPLALSGCKQAAVAPSSTAATRSADPATQIADVRTGEATVAAGDEVTLDVGEYNSSVGDQWGVLDSTHPDVAETRVEYESKGNAPGSPSEYFLVVRGKKAGTTDVTLYYCFRSRMSRTCDQGPNAPVDPIHLTVTVK